MSYRSYRLDPTRPSFSSEWPSGPSGFGPLGCRGDRGHLLCSTTRGCWLDVLFVPRGTPFFSFLVFTKVHPSPPVGPLVPREWKRGNYGTYGPRGTSHFSKHPTPSRATPWGFEGPLYAPVVTVCAFGRFVDPQGTPGSGRGVSVPSSWVYCSSSHRPPYCGPIRLGHPSRTYMG